LGKRKGAKELLLMEEIRRSPVEVGSFFQYKVLYIPGGAGFLPSGIVLIASSV